MKVKLSDPALAPGLLDPVTKRSPFLDAAGKVLDTADVPENTFWMRRVRSGEVSLLDAPMPTGREPVAPLTTRGGK